MKAKSKSKTLWFNIIALVIGLLTVVLAAFGYTGELTGDFLKYESILVAVANIILRFITKEPIVK